MSKIISNSKNHPRCFLFILLIPIIITLLGYGKINAQDIISKAGDYFLGNAIKSITSFSGNISGTAGYCAGVTMPITLSISGGIAPYEVILARTGSTNNKDTILSGINVSPCIIQVKLPGTYLLKSLTDAHTPNPDNGTVSADPVIITVTPSPVVTISGLAPLYDKHNELMVPVSGDPSGGTFSGSGLFNSNGSWYFLPSYATVGTQNIVYIYQESPGSCFGYDTMVVRVLEAVAKIDFPNDKKKYCKNDDPFTITGVNLNNSIGSFEINGGVGLTDNHDNTATITPTLLDVKEYNVGYTYFDGTNLTASDKFEILNTPDISVSQDGNMLRANTMEAVYQWIDCINNNTAINGETNRTFIPGYDGLFAVIISENGCIDTSACYLVNSTDLEIDLIDQNITLYPNPNKGSFSINLDKIYPNIDVTITELDGRIIQKKEYNYSQGIELFLSAPPGQYLLIIKAENYRKVFRIVIN
jgi:hypothetical protein